MSVKGENISRATSGKTAHILFSFSITVLSPFAFNLILSLTKIQNKAVWVSILVSIGRGTYQSALLRQSAESVNHWKHCIGAASCSH
jgi:hypothetical protein